jgi:hypothetical protein
MINTTPMNGDAPESSVTCVLISLWVSHQLLATTMRAPRMTERQVTLGILALGTASLFDPVCSAALRDIADSPDTQVSKHLMAL